jgi:hypothetical protein
VRDDTGWIRKGDGLLVIDRDGDGLITKATELSFLVEKADAKSSLEGLAVLDANKDGKLTAADVRFGELKVWIDANRDGVTSVGELKTLSELGISEIGVQRHGEAGLEPAAGDHRVQASRRLGRHGGRRGHCVRPEFAQDPDRGRRPGVARP